MDPVKRLIRPFVVGRYYRFLSKLLFHIKYTFSFGRIPISWERSTNWGDQLTPVIAEYLSGRKVMYVDYGVRKSFIVIGSVVEKVSRVTTVWGAGLMYANSRLPVPPRHVYAVRGPLTRDLLVSQSIPCPAIYGDPAVLFPLIYRPQAKKHYQVGIIPHYVDNDNAWVKLQTLKPSVTIIDVRQDIRQFVRKVLSCDVILSSSLHGLICAESYGIPNAHIRLSDKVGGGFFKFDDYRLGLGGPIYRRLIVNQQTTMEKLVSQATLVSVKPAQRALLDTCPFIRNDRKFKLQNRIDNSG